MELKNKTISFIGDSITAGYGLEDLSDRYDEVLKKNFNVTNYNYGINGTRLAKQYKPSEDVSMDNDMAARCRDIFGGDIIIIFGGTNDYGHGDAPIGGINDTTHDTFYGAVNTIITSLKNKFPSSKIIFITPIKREGYLKPSTDSSKTENNAYPLSFYVNAIKEVVKKYDGIYLLDAFNLFDVNPDIKSDYDAYTVDGLHINKAGHKKLAELIASFIKSI